MSVFGLRSAQYYGCLKSVTKSGPRAPGVWHDDQSPVSTRDRLTAHRAASWAAGFS